jgi:hypothetical protein
VKKRHAQLTKMNRTLLIKMNLLSMNWRLLESLQKKDRTSPEARGKFKSHRRSRNNQSQKTEAPEAVPSKTRSWRYCCQKVSKTAHAYDHNTRQKSKQSAAAAVDTSHPKPPPKQQRKQTIKTFFQPPAQ